MATQSIYPTSSEGVANISNASNAYDKNTGTYASVTDTASDADITLISYETPTVSGYKSLTLKLYFYANSTGAGDTSYPRYSINGGSTWTQVGTACNAANSPQDYTSSPLTENIPVTATISDIKIDWYINRVSGNVTVNIYEAVIDVEYYDGTEYRYPTTYTEIGDWSSTNPGRAHDGDQTNSCTQGASGSGPRSNTLTYHTWQSRVAAAYSSLNLKVMHSYNNGSGNTATLSYSIDGGSNWTTIHDDSTTGYETHTVSLSASQDLSLLRVKSYIYIAGGSTTTSQLREFWTEGVPAKASVLGHHIRQLMAGG